MTDTTQTVQLRSMAEGDTELLFELQRDPAVSYMAAFASHAPDDREAFMSRWEKMSQDPARLLRIVLYQGTVAGYIAQFLFDEKPTIGYMLGTQFWGKGIMTEAVRQFMDFYAVRPVYARVVQDNIGSRRVLEKVGFRVCGEDQGYALARQAEVKEYVLRLD